MRVESSKKKRERESTEEKKKRENESIGAKYKK